MVQPIEKKSVHEKVVQNILDAIMDGKIVPGQKLASEIQLASDFQISRNMLREAIKTLEVLGIVESQHGRGTFISTYAKQKIANVDFIRSLAGNQTVNDLLETRIVIEPGLAEFAAQRRTPDDIDLLMSYADNMVRDYRDESRNYNGFHLAVARVSRCTILAKYLESVHRQLQLSAYSILQANMSEKHIRDEAEEHRRIVECIIDRDGKGTQRLMYIHLVKRYNMIQSFNKQK